MNFVIGDEIKFESDNLYLPQNVFEQYENFGIKSLFDWQSECIKLEGVLEGTKNLIYSAPTSAGKTLVSEIILLKSVLESKKKALFILPFVSVSREKMMYFKKLFDGVGLKVDGFMGNMSPKGGLAAVDIAVCTIEKANSLINRLIDEESLHQLSLIVIDELHMLGDSHRGYILELLLTKIIYHSKLMRENHPDFKPTQIVGMSATLPNLDVISDWLQASLYVCDFRPIPLLEMVKCESRIYDCRDLSKPLKMFVPPTGVSGKDDDQVISLCLETILSGHGCLIFCPTKAWCETLSVNIATEIVRLCRIADKERLENGFKLREIVSVPELAECVDNLKRCASGLDDQLEKVVPFAVAFHHAGLTNEERDIIETYYRDGIIKILIATSTLSSGVNLPARRVIVRTPLFNKGLIDPMTYKQMIGRAGRKGIDTRGESVMVCKPKDFNKLKCLIDSGIPPINSCLDKYDSFSLKRALLEVIVPRVVHSVKECVLYLKSTFLQTTLNTASKKNSRTNESVQENPNELLIECLQYLEKSDLIVIKSDESMTNTKKRGRPKKVPENSFSDVENDNRLLFSTPLGQAVLSASLGPDDGLVVFHELDKARRALALDTDLHLIYLLTPVYLDVGNIDWARYSQITNSLSEAETRVMKLVGVNERFIIRCCQYGPTKTTSTELQTHKRFFSALILYNLVNECSFKDVCGRFGVEKGNLQALQLQAATYAGMITVFCNRLGWTHLEVLVKSFQKRMTFGVSEELIDLVRISLINGSRARVFFKAGFETVSSIAGAKIKEIVNVLRKTLPFQSAKVGDHVEEMMYSCDSKSDVILGPDGKSLNINDAAMGIFKEAQTLLKRDLEMMGITWNPPGLNMTEDENNALGDYNNNNIVTMSTDEPDVITNKSTILINQNEKETESIKLNESTGNERNANRSVKFVVSESKENNSPITPQSYSKSREHTPLSGILNQSRNGSIHKMILRSSQSPFIDFEEKENDSRETPKSIRKSREVTPSSSQSQHKMVLRSSQSVNQNLEQSNLSSGQVNVSQDSKIPPEDNMDAKDQSDLDDLNSLILNSLEELSIIESPIKNLNDQNKIEKDQNSKFYESMKETKSINIINNDFEDISTNKSSIKNAIGDQDEKHNNFSVQTNVINNASIAEDLNSNAMLDNNSFDDCVNQLMDFFDDSSDEIIPEESSSPATNLCAEKCANQVESSGKIIPEKSPNFLKRSPVEMSTPINNQFPKKLRFQSPVSAKVSPISDSVLVPDSQPVFKTPKLSALKKRRTRNKESQSVFNDTAKSLFTNMSLSVDSNSGQSSNRSSDILDQSINTRKSNISDDLFGDLEEDQEFNRSESLFSSITSNLTFTSDSQASATDNDEEDVRIRDPLLMKPGLSTVNEVSLLQSGSEEFIIDVSKTKKSWNKFVKEFEAKNACETQDFINKKLLSLTLAWKFDDKKKILITGLVIAMESNSLVYFIDLSHQPNTRDSVPIKRKYDFINDLLLSQYFLLVSFDWNLVLSLLESHMNQDFNQLFKDNLIDVFLCDWMLDSENCCHSFLDLCSKYNIESKSVVKVPLNSTLIDLINNKKHDLTTADALATDKDAAIQAVVLLELSDNIRKSIIQNSASYKSIFKHFCSVEMPIYRLIFNADGLTADLRLMQSEVQKVIAVTDLLKEMAFVCTGKPFNINLPKDVSKVLFIDLRLPVPGSLNGGIVTRRNAGQKLTASCKKNLLHLLPLHPLPGIILEYRRLLMLVEKTLNPLVDACQKAIDFTAGSKIAKIRCNYQQLSSTGRITTTSPNLQSVPKPITLNWYSILHLEKNNTLRKKAKELKIDKNEDIVITNFRSCFFASQDRVLVSADYRQLELRILSHFTSDKTLIDFFVNKTDVDIFIKMASKWLRKPEQNITDVDRQQAKQISYGIIYGISVLGLSEQMSIDESLAERMINDFMSAFPEVNRFMKTTVKSCREKGYVETIAGRRRYLPEINSENIYSRAHAERQAVHSTIQGSAADIVKTAMVMVDKAIGSDLQTRLVRQKFGNKTPGLALHLHDELIYEVPTLYLRNMAVILKQNMENAFHLSVPLPVKVKSGQTWSNLEDFII